MPLPDLSALAWIGVPPGSRGQGSSTDPVPVDDDDGEVTVEHTLHWAYQEIAAIVDQEAPPGAVVDQPTLRRLINRLARWMLGHRMFVHGQLLDDGDLARAIEPLLQRVRDAARALPEIDPEAPNDAPPDALRSEAKDVFVDEADNLMLLLNLARGDQNRAYRRRSILEIYWPLLQAWGARPNNQPDP